MNYLALFQKFNIFIMSFLAGTDLKKPSNFELLSRHSINDLIIILGGGWTVKESKKIEKRFTFDSFEQSIAFINLIASLCEEENHHADMLIEFKSVKIIIWTHNVNGLTRADFILGAKIDNLFCP